MKDEWSTVHWTLYACFFLIFIFFGGTVFTELEKQHQIDQNHQLMALKNDIQNVLLTIGPCDCSGNDTDGDGLTLTEVLQIKAAKRAVLNRMTAVCNGINFMDGMDTFYNSWNLYNAVFFAFTICTTIGYGQISPSGNAGRVFVIIYSMIGIPMNGVLLNKLGVVFSKKFNKAHKNFKNTPNKSKWDFIRQVIFYLIPGTIAFIIIPSAIFTVVEGWTYFDSVYYCFTTLTTIGFGDFIAGEGDGHNPWYWFYQFFIMLWISIGLGYLVMILSYITKGFEHKRLQAIVDKRLHAIASSRAKLNHDVASMGQLLEELQKIRHKTSVSNHSGTVGHYSARFSINPTPDSTDPLKLPCETERMDQQLVANMTPNVDRQMQVRSSDAFFENVVKDGRIPDELLSTFVDVISQDMMIKMMDNLNEFQGLEQDLNEVDGGVGKLKNVISDFDESLSRLDASRQMARTINDVIRKLSVVEGAEGPSRKLSLNRGNRKISTQSSRKISTQSSRKISRQSNLSDHVELDESGEKEREPQRNGERRNSRWGKVKEFFDDLGSKESNGRRRESEAAVMDRKVHNQAFDIIDEWDEVTSTCSKGPKGKERKRKVGDSQIQFDHRISV